jgi:hypothetical protein
MVVQEGVNGVFEGHMPPGTRTTSLMGPLLLGIAANTASWGVPRGYDSPGPAAADELLPQQIGALLR